MAFSRKGAREAEFANICDYMGHCGLSPLPLVPRVVYTQSQYDVIIPATILSFPQPH